MAGLFSSSIVNSMSSRNSELDHFELQTELGRMNASKLFAIYPHGLYFRLAKALLRPNFKEKRPYS